MLLVDFDLFCHLPQNTPWMYFINLTWTVYTFMISARSPNTVIAKKT